MLEFGFSVELRRFRHLNTGATAIPRLTTEMDDSRSEMINAEGNYCTANGGKRR